MKTLHITSTRDDERGIYASYEILDGDKVVASGERLVPNGFDRLLIPQADGAALTAQII